jgi:hypothetical protein
MEFPDASQFFRREPQTEAPTESRHTNPPSPPRPTTQQTWERPEDVTGYGSDTDQPKVESVDRPLFLSLVNLVQMMEPHLYLALNPLLLIGSISPPTVEISEAAVTAMNDMIVQLWGDSQLGVALLMESTDEHQPRGFIRPVPELRVLTRAVSAKPKTEVEAAAMAVKAAYKRQDFLECIESGRSLMKLTLLGRLVTSPMRPILRHRSTPGVDSFKASPTETRSRSRHHDREHRSSRRREGSPSSIYSRNERKSDNILGRLKYALNL